jgi:hypothetical protein
VARLVRSGRPRAGRRSETGAVAPRSAPTQRAPAALQERTCILQCQVATRRCRPGAHGRRVRDGANRGSEENSGHAYNFRDKRLKRASFDVPGAPSYTLVFDEGSRGSSLSPRGEATGGYTDLNGTMHGFVRDHRGAITTFDAPGADITPGDGAGTTPLSINPAAEVTGWYCDAQFFIHGFLRDAKGHVTEFDAPDASTACFLGLTEPVGINAAGEITGIYWDSPRAPGKSGEDGGDFWR